MAVDETTPIPRRAWSPIRFVGVRGAWSLAGLTALSGLAAGLQAQTLLGPTAYVGFSNSPFYTSYNSGGFTYFHLETFEDSLLNTPGVTADSGAPYGPGGLTDSVDGDDGTTDGSGTNGHSFAYTNSTGVTFTFNASALGGLPTHVGIVWTDGPNPTFEAFDALGNSMGTLVGNSADGSFSGTTAEDRFFGATNLGGISKISIYATSWEADHLQYGRSTAVPEPATGATLAGATVFALALGLRSRNRRVA